MIKEVPRVLVDHSMFDYLPLLGLQILHRANPPWLDKVNIRFIIIWLLNPLWKQLPSTCPSLEVDVTLDSEVFGVNEGDAFGLKAILVDGACVLEHEFPRALLVIGNQSRKRWLVRKHFLNRFRPFGLILLRDCYRLELRKSRLIMILLRGFGVIHNSLKITNHQGIRILLPVQFGTLMVGFHRLILVFAVIPVESRQVEKIPGFNFICLLFEAQIRQVTTDFRAFGEHTFEGW